MRLSLALGCAVGLVTCAALGPSAARAQSSVTPYFMVIVDTSGSMDATTGTGNNSCGIRRRRLNDAKCVLQQVVNGFGDVTFGLERFAMSCSGTCSSSCGHDCGCSCSYLDCDGCQNDGDFCPATGASADRGQVLVPIRPDNQADIVRWVDFSCGTCGTAIGSNPELSAETWTPIAGSLRAARRYFEGGDPTFGSPIASDPFFGCRPVNVILLTDGEETCAGDQDTIDAATELRSTLTALGVVDVRTYVIGFGISAGDDQIEDIATAGGTDNPFDAANRGFYATDETDLALAFTQIVQDSIRFEVCNGADDDCDTRIDEGFMRWCNVPGGVSAPTLCTNPGETRCDGVDDNCDGTIDEGRVNACGTCGALPTETCNRADDDCDGAIDEGACGGCMPSPEICDGLDNDCNGVIDGITRPCGVAVGICTTGMQTCTAGMWGTCSGTAARTEMCNGLDDDCNGVIDGQVESCGSDVGACQAGSRVCMSGMYGSCIGEILPSTEICNGADDDCDTRTDEGDPGGGGMCGSTVGECRGGTLHCVGGMLTCTGGVSPGMESCNTRDDDCDGRVDEGNPGGGATCGTTDVGECDLGRLLCVSGMLTCTGARGPTSELCNGLDDDCDGMTDEGSPEGGLTCGDDTGECSSGRTICMGGRLVCDGAVEPRMEACNGLDDDCDGAIDDEIPVGAACGSDVGECSPGINVCDSMTGMLVCQGGIGPGPESCNLLDDDCDGAVDEGMADGAACGTDDGICMAGVLRCVEGREICVGEVPGTPEVCDCEDNDCDAMTDEPPMDGSLCPPGSECVECGCARECVMGEFGPLCPTGRAAMMVGDRCFCVAERCNATECAGSTLEADGEVLCAPDSDSVAPCLCRSNECTFACSGVTCADGLVCDPRDPEGACVEDNCRGLGCPDDELCDRTTGACVTDPCSGVTCEPDEACRAGMCEGSCAGVMCGAGETCRAGECVADPCDGVMCDDGEACDPASGECVTDLCEGVMCPSGTVCDPITGECDVDPCDGLRCPTGQVCELGECVMEMVRVDAGVPRVDGGTGLDGGPRDRRILAAGGGGCLCAVPGASGDTGSSSGVWLAGIVALSMLVRRRRRRGAVDGGAR